MNAAELYELLDRLPDACDYFTVRFTTHHRTWWVEPEGWRCDDDGDLILLPDLDGVPYTVGHLQLLLDSGNNDCSWYTSAEVHNDATVFIRDDDEDDDYAWEPTFERFSINWKRKRVDIWIE